MFLGVVFCLYFCCVFSVYSVFWRVLPAPMHATLSLASAQRTDSSPASKKNLQFLNLISAAMMKQFFVARNPSVSRELFFCRQPQKMSAKCCVGGRQAQ